MRIVIILMLVEIFTVVMQRKFCEKAFEKKKVKKWLEGIMWVFFYIFSNVFTYLWNMPVWSNIIIFSTSFLVVLTVLYEGSLKKRLIIVAFLYLMGMVSEIIVGLFGIVSGADMEVIPQSTDNLVMHAILSKLVWFIEIRISLLILDKNHNIEIKKLDWLEVFFIPVSSIFIIITIFEAYADTHVWLKLLAAFFVLIINLFTFYTYNELQEKSLYKAEKKFLTQQVESYAVKLQEMGELWDQMRIYRHEMKQKYLLVQSYIDQGAYEKLKEFYHESIEALKEEECVSRTGNMCFDTIINYKAAIAEKYGIKLKCDVLNMPYDMNLEEEDMYSLLGNLLDNAIEAVCGLDIDERMITLAVKMSGKNMYINMENPYQGELRKQGNRYLTTKREEKEHGIGLRMIQDIVKRHEGEISIKDEDNYFRVEILLYNMGK